MLHCRTLQELFFIKPLLLRAGDVADLPNTEKQMQRAGQNEETQECVSNERKRKKITERELNETGK